MRRIIKKQKQIEKPISMVEPPPCDESAESACTDNRIHQRRRIINELDLIKQRVNQVRSFLLSYSINNMYICIYR